MDLMQNEKQFESEHHPAGDIPSDRFEHREKRFRFIAEASIS